MIEESVNLSVLMDIETPVNVKRPVDGVRKENVPIRVGEEPASKTITTLEPKGDTLMLGVVPLQR